MNILECNGKAISSDELTKCDQEFILWHNEVGDQDCEYTWRQAWTAATLAAGSASPAADDDSYLRDASHPKDMAQAMQWIVGLRNRVDSLLDVINEREVLAHAGVGAEPAKQSIPHRLTLESIQGAICFGREGINPPPSDDHWLAEYWHIGRQLDKLGETSIWDNVTPIEGAAPSSDDVRNAAPVESATDAAMQRACRDLPEFYQVHVELENGCGCVIWYDPLGASHDIEGEGFLSDDINEAVDLALKSAAAQSVGDKKEQA